MVKPLRYIWLRVVSKKLDLIGKKYGRLVVLDEAEPYVHPSGQKMRRWVCQCDCGDSDFTIVRQGGLVSGDTKSCGCLQKELISKRSKTHGMSNSKIYEVWCSMKKRCTNKKNKDYEHYGGRGITVCDSWLNCFETFCEDMGDTYKEGLELDRLDNEQGYSKDNCRWVTRSVNMRNQRKRRGCSSKYKGVSFCKNRKNRPWVACIRYDLKTHYLGYYETELEAAQSYNKEALKHEETVDFLNIIE